MSLLLHPDLKKGFIIKLALQTWFAVLHAHTSASQFNFLNFLLGRPLDIVISELRETRTKLHFFFHCVHQVIGRTAWASLVGNFASSAGEVDAFYKWFLCLCFTVSALFCDKPSCGLEFLYLNVAFPFFMKTFVFQIMLLNKKMRSLMRRNVLRKSIYG